MTDSNRSTDHARSNSASASDGASPELFALKRADIMVIGLVCIGIGVGLGFFLPALGSFAAKFPIPFGEVIEKLSQFDQPWLVIARPIIGAVLGAIATVVITAATTPLRISEDDILVGRTDDHPLRISRASFSTAYFDGGKLTILTEGGHQAYKGEVEGKKDAVAEAFSSRGYRWGEI